MTIPLRKARPEDATAIAALVDAAYAPWVEIIGQKPGPMLDDYAAVIADHWVSVREDEKGIFELQVVILQEDAVLIDNIAVRPDMQGKGIGRRAIEGIEIAARIDGYKLLRLYAHEKMTANIALYERLGFSITKRVRERGLNRVYMEKALEPWPSRMSR